ITRAAMVTLAGIDAHRHRSYTCAQSLYDGVNDRGDLPPGRVLMSVSNVSMPGGVAPQRRPNALWLLAPLILLALVAGALGAFASQTIKPIEKPAYFQLFFSSVIDMKVWLTTAAVVLAVLQVITAT